MSRLSIERLAAGYELGPQRQAELVQDIWGGAVAGVAVAPRRGLAAHIPVPGRAQRAVSHVRHRSRDPKATSTPDDLTTAVDLDRSLDRHDAERRVRAAIATLPQVDRQIAVLMLEELPHTEIAEVTGLAVTHVSTRVHRLKGRLARADENDPLNALRAVWRGADP